MKRSIKQMSCTHLGALYASILVFSAGIVFVQTPHLEAATTEAINNHDTPPSIQVGGLPVLVEPEALPEDFKNTEKQQSKSTSRNEAAVMEHEEAEFPYPLTCRPPAKELRSSFSEKSYTIAMAYHVGMLSNYKTVVKDQLRTLDKCGLGALSSHLILSYSGGNVTDLLKLLGPYDFVQEPNQIVESTAVPWEGAAITALSDYCQTIPQNRRSRTIAFYFHSKGASKWNRRWRRHMDREFSYSRSLYWRKYLEFFTLERPELCIDKILNHGAAACGVHLRHHPNLHYSGNFWAASCDHIVQIPLHYLREGESEAEKYVAAEFWIGRKQGLVSLIQNSTLENTRLYRHLITPDEYSHYASKST